GGTRLVVWSEPQPELLADLLDAVQRLARQSIRRGGQGGGGPQHGRQQCTGAATPHPAGSSRAQKRWGHHVMAVLRRNRRQPASDESDAVDSLGLAAYALHQARSRPLTEVLGHHGIGLRRVARAG